MVKSYRSRADWPIGMAESEDAVFGDVTEWTGCCDQTGGPPDSSFTEKAAKCISQPTTELKIYTSNGRER